MTYTDLVREERRNFTREGVREDPEDGQGLSLTGWRLLRTEEGREEEGPLG